MTVKKSETQNQAKQNSSDFSNWETMSFHDRLIILDECLGEPALLDDESEEEFNSMLECLYRDINPQSSIEYIYLREFAIYTFEIRRLRRYRSAIIATNEVNAVKSLLHSAVNLQLKSSIVSPDWAQRADKAISKISTDANDLDGNLSPTQAKAFALSLDEISKVDRMIQSAETRRMAFIKEIDRRHAQLKKKFHEVIQEDSESSLGLNNRQSNGAHKQKLS